jgi:hypothetical protein
LFGPHPVKKLANRNAPASFTQLVMSINTEGGACTLLQLY